MNQYDYFFKLILIGNKTVGKSSLLRRFSSRCHCCASTVTIGVDFESRVLTIDNKVIKLQIWDPAGQERFRSMSYLFYKGALGVILVYSITDRQSFTDIGHWFGETQNYGNENAVRILIGHKSDLDEERQVTKEEGKACADKFGMKFIEASAKDMTNVDDILTTVAKDILYKALAVEENEDNIKKLETKGSQSRCFGS